VPCKRHDGCGREALDFAGAVRHGNLLTIDGVNLRIEPPRVLETIHEVFVRRDYEFFYGANRSIMIDIGMNVGLTSLYTANDSHFVKIYGFEPLTPTYSLAQENFDLNPNLKSKIECFNFGLSDHDESLAIKFTPNHIMSISSEGTFDTCFGADVTEEKIEVKQASRILGPIIREAKSTDADLKVFLKMDCEGAEYRILADLDAAGLLDEVDVAVIEWHNREPDAILETLARHNFACFTQRLKLEWNVGLIKALRVSGPTLPDVVVSLQLIEQCTA